MAIEAVVDASVFLAFLLEEDLTANAERLFLAGTVAHVPSICDYEIAYVLAKKARRGQFSAQDAVELFRAYEMIRGTVEPLVDYTSAKLEEALREQLSPFDQAYLELAKRLGLPLISADQRHVDQGAEALEKF